jgi:hypothetical protein
VSRVDQELFAHPEHITLTQVFSGVRVALSLLFSTMFYISLFFPLASVLSVLPFVASHYRFGIFKHLVFWL